MMKIKLTQDIRGLGKYGDTVECDDKTGNAYLCAQMATMVADDKLKVPRAVGRLRPSAGDKAETTG